MSSWNYTKFQKQRVYDKVRTVNGVDFFKGRHMIHRDSPVDGGIYVGPNQEGIVVDSDKYPALNKLYNEAKERATENGILKKDKILRAVYETVSEHMKYPDDPNEIERLNIKWGIEHDGKIALDSFINAGVGVCRHDALACAALLEHFKKDGYINGKPSVDRNETHIGGHAWCRYTNSSGDIFILDTAQNFLGKLTDAKGQNRWDYERPEDY